MTIEQWKTLPKYVREMLISSVFYSQYLSLTRADSNPETDPIIQEVLKCCSSLTEDLDGSYVYIDIHKKIKI